MLTISRETKIKAGRHAWNVYPLEAFGFLLGSGAENTVYAALPCSKTRRWHEFGDRWAGVEENIEKARTVARRFDMEVVGFYASTDGFDLDSLDNFPIPSFIANTSMELLMLYQTICCPGHSWASFKCGNHWLKCDEDYVVPRGKRITNSINQKKVLKAWHRVFGQIDYSNRQERDRNGNNAYIAGDRVLHPKFGKGTVIGRTINPEDGRVDRVQVMFDSGCDKWLALEYARLLLLDKNNDKLPQEAERIYCLQRESEPEPICAAEYATLENIAFELAWWEKCIRRFEAGFDGDDEYRHDLFSRECLHGVLNGLARQGMAVPGDLRSRIEAADRQFVELTREVEHDVWGGSRRYDKGIFWYYYRWLINNG